MNETPSVRSGQKGFFLSKDKGETFVSPLLFKPLC